MDPTIFQQTSNTTNTEQRIAIDSKLLDQLEQRSHLHWHHLLESSAQDSFLAIAQEIQSQQPRQVLYHARLGGTVPFCVCGQKLSWHPDKNRYRDYCSRACTARYSTSKKKQKNLATLGVEWHSQTRAWSEKVRDTSQKKFGQYHYSQTDEFKQRRADTCRERFGVDHPAQSPEIRKKMIATSMARYGVDNPAKLSTTNYSKYSVGNVAQAHINSEILGILNDPEKLQLHCQQSSVRELARSWNISVNPIYDRISRWNLIIPRWGSSSMEREIQQFISACYHGTMIIGDRSILSNRQLDIWLPDINLAIECNGTYWHSESQGRGPKYHLDKTLRCLEKNIGLLHIWEHDWYQKRSIVESMLLYRLGLCKRSGARGFTVHEISTQQCRTFMEENHLQAWAPGANVCLGLQDPQGTIMAAMALGRNRFGSTPSWEMLRFATRKCYSIAGASSKLFKEFCRLYQPQRVISYSDRASTTGKMYQEIGFEFDHHSRPNYHYTKDYTKLHSRNAFQKHNLKNRLEIFDAAQTEWQNMQQNGWDRIWDCGNSVYIWTAK